MVRTFSLASGQRTQELRADDVVLTIALYGSVLLGGSKSGMVTVWSLASEEGERITTLGGHTHSVRGVAVSASGGFVASMSDMEMIMWQPVGVVS